VAHQNVHFSNGNYETRNSKLADENAKCWVEFERSYRYLRLVAACYKVVFISKLTYQFSSFFVQNFVQRTSTLWKQRLHFAETTQLWAKIVDNFVRIMFTLCTNVNFVRTTSSFNEQRQLCKNNVHTCPNSAESTMRKREIIDWLAGRHGCA